MSNSLEPSRVVSRSTRKRRCRRATLWLTSGVSAVIAAATMFAPAPAALAQDELKPDPLATFKFAPITPLTLTEQSVTRRTTITAGVDPTEEVTTLTRKMTISSDGPKYSIAIEPISYKAVRADKEIHDPVLDVVKNATLTYRLDEAGRIERIEGFEGIAEKATKSVSKDLAKVLTKLLSPAALEKKERAQWDSHIGILIGQKAFQNSAWIGEAMHSLPDGSVAMYYVANLMAGVVERDGRKLAKIKVLYTADLERLPRLLNDTARDVVSGYARPRPLPTVPGFAISGSGERLIDPESMVVVSDNSQWDIQVSLQVGKDDVQPVLIQERRESKILTSAPAVR